MKQEYPKGMKKGGMVFVISAPSGTGKTTLLRSVMEQLPGLRFSVSYTTRPARSNEEEGKDYHFVSLPVFREMVEKDEFLEWAEVLGNLYGTPRVDLDALASEGVDLILDIDTQGARKVVERVRHSVFIFVLPPSPIALRERLIGRGLDSPEIIKFRLASAIKEIGEAHWYHYVIVNETMEEAVEQLKAIIIAERCRRLKDAMLDEKKEEWEERYGKNYGGRLS